MLEIESFFGGGVERFVVCVVVGIVIGGRVWDVGIVRGFGLGVGGWTAHRVWKNFPFPKFGNHPPRFPYKYTQ